MSGELSPWQRLMEYCKKHNTYVTALRLTMGTQTQACPSNAVGYWQAHGMPTVQGVECDEELHKWRGIGWVENNTVQIIWGARDPQTKQIAWWRDSRPAKNQAQIVWAKPSLQWDGENGNAEVRNLKNFQDKIVAGE